MRETVSTGPQPSRKQKYCFDFLTGYPRRTKTDVPSLIENYRVAFFKFLFGNNCYVYILY